MRGLTRRLQLAPSCLPPWDSPLAEVAVMVVVEVVVVVVVVLGTLGAAAATVAVTASKLAEERARAARHEPRRRCICSSTLPELRDAPPRLTHTPPQGGRPTVFLTKDQPTVALAATPTRHAPRQQTRIDCELKKRHMYTTHFESAKADL